MANGSSRGVRARKSSKDEQVPLEGSKDAIIAALRNTLKMYEEFIDQLKAQVEELKAEADHAKLVHSEYDPKVSVAKKQRAGSGSKEDEQHLSDVREERVKGPWE